MRQSLDDFLLVAGNNELNVAMIPSWKPRLVSLTVPSVPSGGLFTVEAVILLPKPLNYVEGWYGAGEWLPAGTIETPVYIISLYCPDLFWIEPWTNTKVYFEILVARRNPDDLVATDHLYNFLQALEAILDGEPLPPGSYDITGTIVAHTGWLDGSDWGTTSPYMGFSLGVVGELVVT